MFSRWILRNVGILLEDFSNLVCSFKFQISTQLFMEENLQPKVFPKKFEVLVLLLPVAIVSPYAAWKAWHPRFEPLASPPKIEFKSIEVPSSSSWHFLRFCVSRFLFSMVFRCCSHFFFGSFKFHLFLSKSFEWSMVVKSHSIVSQIHQVKNPMQNFVEGFSSLVVARISKELHGLNLAPIEPQVFIKNSFACEGFDGTRMALLDAGGLVTNVSFNFLSFVSQMIVSCVCGGRIIFNVWAFISFTCLPDLRDDCSLLAGSFSDVCVLSFLFICFHAMIFLLLSWPDACLARITFQCAHCNS